MVKPNTYYLQAITEDHKFLELGFYFLEDATEEYIEHAVKIIFFVCQKAAQEQGLRIAQIAIYKGERVNEYRELLLESERNKIQVPLPKAQVMFENLETGKCVTVEKNNVSATYVGIEQFKVGETQGELHDSLYAQASTHVRAITTLLEITNGELLVRVIPEERAALEQLFNEVNEKEYGRQLRFKWISNT